MPADNKSEDRRVRRTRRKICEAFISLLMQKDISQITVKELSAQADINRKTFYMYFSGIDELVCDLENNLVDNFIDIFNHFSFLDESFDALLFFESLNRIIRKDIALYRRINEIGLLPRLISRIKDAIIEIFMKQSNLNFSQSKERYILYAEYAASGILSMYARWFSDDSQITLEELTKTAGEITFYGFQSILKKIDVEKKQ